MAKQKFEFRVPYTVYHKGRVYTGVWPTLAVTVDEAEAHTRYDLVLWKNKSSIYRGGIIEFGDTQTVDGQRPRAAKPVWKQLQAALIEFNIYVDDKTARDLRKEFKITAKNIDIVIKKVVQAYHGGDQE